MKKANFVVAGSVLAASLSCGVVNAASTVNGYAVSGVNSVDTSYGMYNGSGELLYYIPLSSACTGTYGAAKNSSCSSTSPLVGFGADIGQGVGYNAPNSGALALYMYFDLSDLDNNAVDANLTFDFLDLDLTPVNDPGMFFEDIEFSFSSGGVSPVWTDITKGGVQNVTDISQLDDIANNVEVSCDGKTVLSTCGNNDPIRVVFQSLQNVNGNDFFTGKDGLWVEMLFGSDFSGNWGKNTVEHIVAASANASYPPTVVPIPAAVWLFASALGVFGYLGKRKAKA